MNGENKIRPEHLGRKAIVYLRQSSPGQVLHNKESQALQYALAARAHALGFANVEVVDEDLGSSAAAGARVREGFERVLAQVALNQVGLVLSREVSRLLRTDKDFCRLLELCQLFDTLVGDDQSLYNTNALDDQLVLGIKGTLSVIELRVLRMRLVEEADNKARRGELYRLLAPGYVLDAMGKPVKDPDLRVQEALGLVFAKFREISSIRQTFKWFRDNNVELPVNKSRGGKLQVVFQLPALSLVSDILHNPFFAGAYVYGRRPIKTVWEGGAVKKRQGGVVPLSEVKVFLRDHHEGYIDWGTYEENQRMIRRNNLRQESDASVGAIRAGHGLLQGLLRCGRCGRRVHVRYWGRAGTSARYLCSGDFGAGGRYCLGFSGRPVDQRFGAEVLSAISPLGIRASVQAAERLNVEDDARRKALERQVEQLDYEGRRAFEQYNEVDPRNRLVASELERRWNAKLDELEKARQALSELDKQRPTISDEDREKVLSLGDRFQEVWNSPECPMELKKRIIRAVIEEAVVSEASGERLRFVVRWKGGTHTAFEMEKPRSDSVGKTCEEDLEIVRKMAVRYGDDVIAAVLNKLGRRTGKDNRWSQDAVKTARRASAIAGHSRTVEDPENLSMQGAARYLDVSDTTIGRLVKAGILPKQQVVPCAPWEIRRTDLDSDPVQHAIQRLKHTGRLELPGGTSNLQQKLFE
jgi:DNA invertase Pin-like site-specific DNA recombinase